MKQSGLTAIELLVAVASVFLAFWLALQFVTCLQGSWRWVVAAVVFVASYAAFGFLLLVGFIYFFGSLCDRWDRRKKTDETTRNDN